MYSVISSVLIELKIEFPVVVNLTDKEYAQFLLLLYNSKLRAVSAPYCFV